MARRVRPRKIGIFTLSLALFVLAITLIKAGARDFAPVVSDRLQIDGIANSLGFGWLFAYVVMSGSPVAAAALAFLDAGAVDRLETLAIITGSRLGAGLIVLAIGMLYVLRGRDRATSLGMGLLALTVTGATYSVALVLGAALLQSGWLDGLQFGRLGVVTSVVDAVFEPVAWWLAARVPAWSLFPIGLAVILASFSLFDRSLPQMSVKVSPVGQISALVYRPWVMFALGASITLVSMSVSLSLSILVPLADRGLVRRENVVPYIMGANITTFIDTLLAAVLLGNPDAFTVVVAEMSAIVAVSLAILAFGYDSFARASLDVVAWITASKRHLALFLLSIFVVPFVLMLP